MTKFTRLVRRLRFYTIIGGICIPGASVCPGGSALTASYGYLEVQPPSSLFEPGSMITILHEHPLQAAMVCGPRGSLGSDHVAERSRTMGQSLSKLNQKTIDLEVSFTESIKGNARFKKIHRIALEINNARITEVRDEAVIVGRRKRSRDCQDCIDNRISAGFKPVMISSALSGDMTMHIYWESDARMSAKAKIDTLSQLAVELGGGAHSITESTITVSNLIFGIRYSRYLAALSMPNAAESSVNLDAPGMRQDIGYEHGRSPSIRIDPVPDAPVVLPQGYDPTKIGWVQNGDVRQFLQPLPSLREGAPLLAPQRPPSRATLQRQNVGKSRLTETDQDEISEGGLRTRSHSL